MFLPLLSQLGLQYFDSLLVLVQKWRPIKIKILLDPFRHSLQLGHPLEIKLRLSLSNPTPNRMIASQTLLSLLQALNKQAQALDKALEIDSKLMAIPFAGVVHGGYF